jgi:hypothetical protein
MYSRVWHNVIQAYKDAIRILMILAQGHTKYYLESNSDNFFCVGSFSNSSLHRGYICVLYQPSHKRITKIYLLYLLTTHFNVCNHRQVKTQIIAKIYIYMLIHFVRIRCCIKIKTLDKANWVGYIRITYHFKRV